jgi:superfamily II DNA helicase RecQ
MHQKTLMALIEQLPSSITELKTIKGFGKKKVKQFGNELLDIINAYRLENNQVKQ